LGFFLFCTFPFLGLRAGASLFQLSVFSVVDLGEFPFFGPFLEDRGLRQSCGCQPTIDGVCSLGGSPLIFITIEGFLGPAPFREATHGPPGRPRILFFQFPLAGSFQHRSYSGLPIPLENLGRLAPVSLSCSLYFQVFGPIWRLGVVCDFRTLLFF